MLVFVIGNKFWHWLDVPGDILHQLEVAFGEQMGHLAEGRHCDM
jgi:hypothetical protein